MHESNPTKRIPKSIGTDAKLFGNYTLTDLAVALLPGVLVVLFMQVVLPSSLSVAGYSLQALTLPLAAIAILVGALFVYLTPSYTTSLDWLGTFVRFQREDSDLTHDDAKGVTQIERVHPDRDAIERTDGAFVGMVQVDPPTMALATDEEWAETAEAFQDFCNTAIQFPVQLYSTTQPFPVDAYLDRFESRLDDQDVKDNPQLEALIENYVDWYERDLAERRMTIRDHYVVVAVRPAEVQFDQESLAQKLADVPILGMFVRAKFAPRREEEREAMFDELDERLRQIESGIREIEGCNSHRVDATEATKLVGEFWAGEPREFGDIDTRLRRTPVVGGSA